MDNQTKKLLIVVGVALAVLWIAKPKNNIIDSARVSFSYIGKCSSRIPNFTSVCRYFFKELIPQFTFLYSGI